MAGLYRTHEINPKNAKNFIGVDDPYFKKPPVNSRHKSRQFQSEPPKHGQTAGYFKQMDYSSQPFLEIAKYIEIEPVASRKMGFGSKDARKRSEFTLDMRARQFKERVKSEEVYINNQLAQSTSIEPEDFAEYTQRPTDPRLFQSQVSHNLYDIGKEQFTPVCLKCPRDTFFCPHRAQVTNTDTLRRTGELPVMSQTYGDFDTVASAAKPKHGRVNLRKHFYDNSHITTGTQGR